MTHDRPMTRMDRLPAVLRGLGRLWAQAAGGAGVIALLFGPLVPVMVVVFLLTLGLPILALYLWGRALDERLGWLRDDEGPW